MKRVENYFSWTKYQKTAEPDPWGSFSLEGERNNSNYTEISLFSQETAFLFVDRKGHLEGHTATFVFSSIPTKRSILRESKNSILNCLRWLSTCCYGLLIEGETKMNSFLCAILSLMHFLLSNKKSLISCERLTKEPRPRDVEKVI